jgi:hypothetical protein
MPLSESLQSRSPFHPTSRRSVYLSLLASRSDSSRQRISFSRTGKKVRSVSRVIPALGCIHTWALDVADDASGGVVHELDADLGHTSTRACNPSESCLVICPFAFPVCLDRIRGVRGFYVPVRPRTRAMSVMSLIQLFSMYIPRVTLTSLTGTFAASISADCAC